MNILCKIIIEPGTQKMIIFLLKEMLVRLRNKSLARNKCAMDLFLSLTAVKFCMYVLMDNLRISGHSIELI